MSWKRLFQTARTKTVRRVVRRTRLGVEALEARNLLATSFLGVGAGDATSSDAILWTRAKDSASTAGVGLMAQVSTDPTFATGLATFAGVTDPAHDYTIHVDATGLDSGTRYYYRFVASDNTVSQVGTFVTAPDPTAHVPVSFGFTGDADGLLRPYDATASANFAPPTAAGAGPQNYDYFVWLGDTIYETASGAGTPNSSPATADPFADPTQALADYWRKYREQFLPVSTGDYAGLTNFFDSNGHYTLLDNHELGNKQFINGGAPPGTPAGAGVDATDPANDVNTTGTYINQTPGFQAVQQAYTDYQPIRQQTVSAPGDPRSDGTQQLYFDQQWGANSLFLNLDDRSYRDIRLKTATGADDTGVRADNPDRTMLGKTQLEWAEQQLLDAQNNGTIWKFVAISSPIDQIGPIGGSFTINNSADPSAPPYTNTESDGGKSWMGAYRAERNAFLKFIADNHIDHVVFLTTDDHQLRINELGYFTQFDANGTPIQSSYTRVPGAFEILAGPIGATGPELSTDHSFANIQALAQSFASQQIARGIDPIGLDPHFPGLKNVTREGDPNANADRSPVDFYSPDTFNYISLSVSADGSTLSVTLKGINSYAVNTFPEPGADNPVRNILSFQIGLEKVKVAVPTARATAGGTTTLTATLTDARTHAPLAGRTLVFSLNGEVVGEATTDRHGTATLRGVSVAGLLPGSSDGAVTVRFAGDAADLPGGGSAALNIRPARDVTDLVRVQTERGHSGTGGTSTVQLVITNRGSSGDRDDRRGDRDDRGKQGSTLTGLFAVQLSELTRGVTLESATVVVGGVTYQLTITHNAAGDPIINVPAAVATRLAPGQSLPAITLVFKNPRDKRVDFDAEVFTDPLA